MNYLFLSRLLPRVRFRTQRSLFVSPEIDSRTIDLWREFGLLGYCGSSSGAADLDVNEASRRHVQIEAAGDAGARTEVRFWMILGLGVVNVGKRVESGMGLLQRSARSRLSSQVEPPWSGGGSVEN